MSNAQKATHTATIEHRRLLSDSEREKAIRAQRQTDLLARLTPEQVTRYHEQRDAHARAQASKSSDASAPEAWGSGMFESACASLERLKKEERGLWSQLEQANARGDTPAAKLIESKLSTELRPYEPTPLLVCIAHLEDQIKRYHARGSVKEARRAADIRLAGTPIRSSR